MKQIKCIIPMIFAAALFSCASSPKTASGQSNEIPDAIQELETPEEDSAENYGGEGDGNAVAVFEDDENADALVDDGESVESEFLDEDDEIKEYEDASSDGYDEYSDENDDAFLTEEEEEPLPEERVFPDELSVLPEFLNSDPEDENDSVEPIVDEINEEEPELPELVIADIEEIKAIEENEDESEPLENRGNREDSDALENSGQQQSDVFVAIGETPSFEADETDEGNDRDADINKDELITETDYTAEATMEDSKALAGEKADDAIDVLVEEPSEDSKRRFDTLPKASRTMVVKKGQTIEIVYPGRGWIYQENIDSDGNSDTRNRNFIFGGRKLGVENQVFTVRSRNPGKYMLHFYKNDALTEEYIDDYLEVFVEDESASSSKPVVAPDYAAAVPQKPAINAENANSIRANAIRADELSEPQKTSESKEEAGATKDAFAPKNDFSAVVAEPAGSAEDDSQTKKVEAEPRKSYQNIPETPVSEDAVEKTVVQTSNGMENFEGGMSNNGGSEENEDDAGGVIDIALDDEPIVEMPQRNRDSEASESLLEQAKNLYEEKKYSAALDATRMFLNTAALRLDEALYLQGQILEAKSEVQNIRGAIDSYDELVRRYPASELWDAANKRSIYLKRFYIDIR